jgi:modulator of FtsH protease HflK
MADQPKIPGSMRLTPTPVTSADDASSQALNEALGSSFLLVRIMVALLLGAFIFSCVFTVEPNEVAVVLRFGKPRSSGADTVLRPGLQWAFPYPIDEIVRIRTGETKTVRATNAWYATSPGDEALGAEPMAQPTLAPGVDGYVLTSDQNILHVRAAMKYRVADPLTFAFKFANITNLLANVLDNTLYWTSARFTADNALYKEPTAFREAIVMRMRQQIDSMNLGIAVDEIVVDTRTPAYVKQAFDAVIAAEQDRSKKVNVAEGYFNERVRTAEGEAAAIRFGGMVSSNALIQAVSAEAKYFQDQLPYYLREPDLLRARLRIEALSQVLTNAADKFFVPDRPDGSSRELRIQINREPLAPVRRDPNAPLTQ